MARAWFTAKSVGTSGEIVIYDEIGAFGISAKDFRDELNALGDVENINLRINSPGGEVFTGLTVYNMLARHKATITVTVDGIAASIASLIAMAGDTVVMPDNAMMMIHDPSGIVLGTSQDMRDLADALDKMKSSMIAIYADKSGMSRNEIAQIMSDETWLTASEAKAMGFADKVEKPVRIAAGFDLSKFRNAPAIAGQPRGRAAQHLSQQEIIMTDAEKAAAEKAEAEAKAKAEAEVKEKAEAEAKAKAEAEARASAETERDTAIKAERQRAADIYAACQLAGQPEKAPTFVADGKTLSEVVAALRAKQKPGEDTITRNGPEKPAASSWDKHINAVNARIPGAQ